MASDDSMITCEYCQTYQESNDRNTITDAAGKKILRQTRKCRYTGEHQYPSDSITRDGKKCEFFKPNPYFWCSENSNRIHLKVCERRMRSEEEEKCPTCRQGRIVKTILERDKEERRKVFKRKS